MQKTFSTEQPRAQEKSGKSGVLPDDERPAQRSVFLKKMRNFRLVFIGLSAAASATAVGSASDSQAQFEKMRSAS